MFVFVVQLLGVPGDSLATERGQVSSSVTGGLDPAHTTLSPLIPPCLPSAGTCVNNTSVMMFKKGSFEIGSTIYPVAIKVLYPPSCQSKTHFSLWLFSTRLTHIFQSPLHHCTRVLFSTTPSLETLSGTAPSTAWWTTCWGWWPAGPSTATSGTCPPCISRCVCTRPGAREHMHA